MGKSEKVGVIGAGAWGTTLAQVLSDAGQAVTVWSRDPEVARSIRERGENARYLRGQPLSKKILSSSDLIRVVRENDVLVCAVPTQSIRSVFSPHAADLKKKWIVNASKGIEQQTYCRVSEIFKSISPESFYSVISGPSFAQELIRRLPAAVTVASIDATLNERLQKLFATEYFRTYSALDVVGVELSGALKNVIAIAAGSVVGLQLGYNAQAALINRGIVEMSKLGRQLGADPITFLGLSGMGDLVLTCTGPLSRNRKLGVLLAEGMGVAQALKKLEGVAEGYYTSKAAVELSARQGVDMPITAQIYRILYEGGTPQQALTELMSRDLKPEWG